MRSLLALSLLLVCNRASAHHSFAMYDPAQLVHVVGTVRSFQWTNPHVMVWVVKDEPAGDVWTIELPTSPGNLARMGWSKHSLKPGDRVDVEINPLRDGQHAGSFKKATVVETGEVLVAAAPGPSKDGAANGAGAAPDDDLPAARDCGAASDEHALAPPPVSGGGWAGPTLALVLGLSALAWLVRRLRRVDA
jgi:hypothetical protein